MRPAKHVLPASLLPPTVSALAVADPNCRRCGGLGKIETRLRPGAWTCACVFHNICRACLRCYRSCEASLGSSGGVLYENLGHTNGKCAVPVSHKRAEYAADFMLLVKRALQNNPVERAAFHAHDIARQQWREAVPALNRSLKLPRPLDRGTYYHAVYRAEAMVGQGAIRTHPYSLYPPGLYFSGSSYQRVPAVDTPR